MGFVLLCVVPVCSFGVQWSCVKNDSQKKIALWFAQVMRATQCN